MSRKSTTRPRDNRNPEHTEPSRRTKRAEKSESTKPSDQWEDRVRQIAREVFSEMFASFRTVPADLAVEGALPLPHRTGRKEDRSYRKITVTLDEVLAERLLSEAKKQRLSPGKILDQVLWERYGRPALSYQTERSDTPETN